MDFGKKSKVSPAVPSQHKLPTRRASLIEDYYAWRQNEFQAAIAEAAKKEALHKTPPPSPILYERKVAKIDGKTYEKNRRKELLEEVGDHSLDIFKPKKKKFAMYPVVPHTPDETPCMSPNLSSASLSSHPHHDHHQSFPHMPDIEESEHEEDDTPTKPMVFNFNSNSSLNGKNGKMDNKTELERMMERKLLPNDPNKPEDLSNFISRKKMAPVAPTRRVNDKKALEIDLERNLSREMKYSKWEIAQEFVPWVMIVTSIIQVIVEQ